MPKLFTTDGLVIRRFPVGDNDQLLYILTPQRGRLSVRVRHGQSGRTPLDSISQLFTYGNFEISQSRDFCWLRGGSVLHSFYELTTTIERVALGTYLCDVAASVSGEDEWGGNDLPEDTPDANGDEFTGSSGQLLRMLLNSLYALGTGQTPRRIIKGVFELRTAAMSGYRPSLISCSRCGCGYPDLCFLDVMNGSLLCADCKTALNRLGGRIIEQKQEELGERSILVPLSSSALAAVRYAMTAPDKKLFSFALKSDEEEIAFAKAAETYLLNHLEHGFDSLDFYHSVAD